MERCQQDASMPIAVIGMACRFPGDATSPDKLWDMLINGRSAWSEFPDDRINIDGFYHPSGIRAGSICFKGGHFLKGNIAAWDAPFFSTTAHEAAAMDPQQRILLEVSYEAFENAGIPMETLPGSATAVYCGSFVKDYEQIVMRDPDDTPQYAATGNGIAIMSNRISWFYDLRGPSMTLDTGCSASLVGVHLACQSIRTGESTLAIAMGAGLILTPSTMLPMTALNFLSPDGKCFTFDERANGYGRGEGVGAVVLKPLDAALRDGDTIRAVIRGSGVNQDGRTPGITMPSQEAQAMNIRAVYKSAGLSYNQTAYFEAHGTGTQAGDPKELGAISETFAETRDANNSMYVGSLKTNIGHLEGCAGIAGLIKGILVLENGVIPPNLYFEKVNPQIDLEGWKIKVPTQVTRWPMEGLRRVSINCFGFGGTNAHIILDDALHYLKERGIRGKHSSLDLGGSPAPSLVDSGYGLDSPATSLCPGLPTERHRLYVISSHEECGISRVSDQIFHYIANKCPTDSCELDLSLLSSNLAYTLACRRSVLPWRSFIVSTSVEQEGIHLHGTFFKPIRSSHEPRVAFIFSGQGAQWYAMGRELFIYPAFADSLLTSDAYLKSIGSEWSLLNELLKDKTSSMVDLPRISQPLCTALQIALVDLLNDWGLRPTAVVGHSSGEIAAAYCVGALSRQNAWKLAYHRGRLTSIIKYLAPGLRGRMIAIALSKEAVEPFIMRLTSGSATVACINSPESVTVSGDEAAIFELQNNLKANGMFARLLKVENAYHSWHMKTIEQHYIHAVKNIQASEMAEGRLMFSTVTGQVISGVDLGATYWAKNLVSPVIFSEAVSSLLQSTIARPDVLLEIGPHSVLQTPLKQILDAYHKSEARPASISILQRGKNAAMTALQAAGELWTRGYPIDLKKVNMDLIDQPHHEPQVLNDLPPYPFNHSKSYWHESHLGRAHRFRQFGRRDLIGAPALDSTPFEPRWRGFIRISENPWVLDHQVQNTVIYPAAGMIVMVLEAAQQLRDISRIIDGYEIRKMHVDRAMIIPTIAHGLETALNLRLQESIPGDASRSSSYEFSQYSKALNAPWQQNCHGILVIHYGAEDRLGSFIEEEVQIGGFPVSYKHVKSLCTESIIPRQLYETLESIGMKYGPTFQNISWIQKHDNFSCFIVRIPDTSDRMPAKYEYPHLIHPATLDAMFQTMFVAGSEPMVPTFLEEIFISVDLPRGAGYEFHGHSRATRNGLRDAVGTIIMSDDPDDKPKIIVNGLHFTALSTSTDDFSNARFLSNHHTLCADLVWKEWIGSAKVTTLGDWLDLAAQQKPGLNMLDCRRAGSGNATPPLKILGQKSGFMRRFWKYTFATADPAMFDQLNRPVNDRNELIDYKKLSLDEDVTKQGFTKSTYDVIFAFADGRAQWTKLASLLKPSGKLLLFSQPVCHDTRMDHASTHVSENWTEGSILETSMEPSIFSLDYSLKEGFSLTDQVTVLSLSHPSAAALSQRKILLVLPRRPSDQLKKLSKQLSETLMLTGGESSCVELLAPVQTFSQKLCILLLEVDEPLVYKWTSDEFYAFRNMIHEARGCLWITQGGQMNSGVPFASPINNLFRTIRSEDPQQLLYTLDLDARTDLNSKSTSRAIITTFHASFDYSLITSEEMEYAECDGKVYIPRLIPHERLNSVIERGGTHPTPQPQPYLQPDRPLRLEISTLGDLETLYFNDDIQTADILAPHEVEIRVRASGLRPIDVRTAMGKTSNDCIGLDVTGVISQVGALVSNFRVGQRVACITRGAFRSLVRSHVSLVQSIPDDISMEVAASIPSNFATARFAILKVGRLQRGESVLIHQAESGLGQALIYWATFVNAKVFLAVDSARMKKRFVEMYGLQENHIFEASQVDYPKEILRLTGSKGVDLLLNTTGSNGLRRAWSCVNEFGRFVELSSYESERNMPENVIHRPNVTYSTVDFDHMLRLNPSLVSQLLSSTFDSVREGLSTQIMPPRVWNYSEIKKAFRELELGVSDRATVLRANDDDMVQVVPKNLHPLLLGSDATYVLVGGLGGLGRSLAKLLVNHGARNLAFISRTGATSEEQIAFLINIEKEGIIAKVYRCDVCDRKQLEETLIKCEDEMPRIRGVIHGAAVIRDAIFDNMTYEDWVSATRPKMQGSWNLHELLPKDLNFFVLLSSSAGVMGARGQANYNAGNGFQDALAHHRRKMGLSAVSLDLGIILGAGMVAEDEDTLNILRSSGFSGIREKDFHALISAAITGYVVDDLATPPQVIVGTGTGGLVKQNQVADPYWHREARFSLMREVDVVPDSTGPTLLSLKDHLSDAGTVSDAVSAVVIGLATVLSKAMNMAASDIDTRKPANAYGVDSLVAVGTRNWILRETGVDVSIFDILSEMSLLDLADRIVLNCKFVAQSLRSSAEFS